MNRPCPYCVNGRFEGLPCEDCDGTGEAARRVWLDLGHGVKATVSVRGDVSERTMEALQHVAEAAYRMLAQSQDAERRRTCKPPAEGGDRG